MYQKYVKEDNVYLVTNKAVARTSIFGSRHYCERFLYQLRRYIGPLGKIVGYALKEDEFAFVIVLDGRSAFEKYHIARQEYEGRLDREIPESTYIFSRAMANLQASTAKHFNKREDREGALFASRFKKKRIEDHASLLDILGDLWKGIQLRRYRRKWRDHTFNDRIERKSWCFNFKGLIDEIGDYRIWGTIGGGIRWLFGEWVVKFNRVLQGRLRKTYFFHKIPFDLPIFNPTNAP